MSAYIQLISDCESDLRSGRAAQAARRLQKINTAKVPREWRLPLATICRRASQFALGLTLLARVVHPKDESNPPTLQEKAEYAALLLRSGALTEALNTLKDVDAKLVPEANLFRAFCHFSLWEFREAIPHLQDYLSADIAPYAHLVGRVNLAFALTECAMGDQALALLDENIFLADQGGHARLKSNCHALRAHVHIQTGSYAKAKVDLNEASALIGAASTNDGLFISKWRLILEGLESGSTEPFRKLKSLAEAGRDWEASREADFFSLKVGFDRRQFSHLLFGTPFSNYRSRIVSELGRVADSDFHIWGATGAPLLDLASGTLDGKISNLKAGRKCHQLVDVLLRDFYRSTNLGGLFSSLFPGEHFDIFTSPDRVHQILRRTRRWLQESSIPLSIEASRGFYALKLTGEFGVRVPLEREGVECMNLHFQKLVAKFESTPEFSAKAATQELGLSRRTMQRLLTWGIENGKIERHGPTKTHVVYRIVSHHAARNAEMRIAFAA